MYLIMHTEYETQKKKKKKKSKQREKTALMFFKIM